MALSLGELVAYLKVDSGDFDSGMDRSEGKFSGFAKKAAGYGVAVGTGILAAGTALFAVGATFDDVTDTIRVGTGATGKALDGLVDSAKNIGRDIPASFEAIGTTVADVNTRLGLTGPTLEKLSSQILEAGRLLGTEIDVNGLSSAFSAFNVTGDDTTKVMDDLFRISQATGVGINELAAGVATGAPQLRQFGFSIGESAALLGNLDKAGLNSDATIAALSRGMIDFAKEGRKPREALEETIEGIEGFIAKGDQAKALDLAASIFGTRGAGQFVAAVQSGKLNLDDLMAATGATSDTILGASDDTKDFAESWQIFKNRALLAVEPIATRVFNTIGQGMEWFLAVGVPALQQFGASVRDAAEPLLTMAQWINDNRTPITVVAGLIAAVFIPHLIALAAQAVVTRTIAVASWIAQQAAAIGAAAVHSAQIVLMIARWAALGATAVAQGIVIAAVWTGSIIASAVAGAASFAVQVARVVGGWVLMGAQAMIHAARMAAAWLIAMGPVGWVIAAVVGLVALIVANWDTVVSWTQTAWSAVTGAIGAAWEWIKGVVSAGLNFLVMLFMNFTGVGLIIKHWDSIKNATSAAWNWVTSTVSGAWNAVTGAISSGVSTAVSFVAGLPGKVLGAIGNMGSLLYQKGKDLIQGLLNGAGSLLSKIGSFFLDKVPGWIKAPFKAALGINSPSTVFAGYGTNIGEGLVVGMAKMRPAVAAEMAALADVQALGALQGPTFTAGHALGGPQTPAMSPGYTDTAAGTPGSGPLLNVENLHLVEGTPRDVANELAVTLRTGGI